MCSDCNNSTHCGSEDSKYSADNRDQHLCAHSVAPRRRFAFLTLLPTLHDALPQGILAVGSLLHNLLLSALECYNEMKPRHARDEYRKNAFLSRNEICDRDGPRYAATVSRRSRKQNDLGRWPARSTRWS